MVAAEDDIGFLISKDGSEGVSATVGPRLSLG